MEKKIDLLDFLSRVVLENTRAYQSDFEQDVKTLVRAAEEPNMENRVFYWMSRPCGTWCVKEREVFLRDSEAYHIWTHYESMPEGIRTYRVVVTGRQDGRIIGDVLPLHYREQVQRVMQAALPIATVEAAYPNGYIARMDFAEWEQCRGRLYERYGRPVRIRYAPENEAELTRRVMLEHRFQKGWKRKPHTKTPDPPSR